MKNRIGARAKGAALKMGMFAVLIVGAPSRQDVYAFVPTEDLLNYSQNVIKWMDDKLSAAQQIENLISQLATAKNTLAQIETVYRKVMPFIQDGQAYWNVYNAFKRVKYDYDALTQYYKNMVNAGHFSIARARSVLHALEHLNKDYLDALELFDAVFNPNNALSQKERIDLANKIAEEINQMADELERSLKEDTAKVYDEYSAISSMAILEDALMPEDQLCAITIDEQRVIDSALTSITGKLTSDIERAGLDSDTALKVFDAVSIIIGVLAVLMIPWGYARYVKTGERQHQDALWKVFAGLLFVLLMLQCLKAAFFGSGIFTSIG